MTALAVAGEAEGRLFCNGEEIAGWHFYCDPEPEAEPEPAPAPLPEPQEPVAEDAPELPEEPSATERIEAFRKRADELKNRAILDPTPENLQAYMQVNAEMAAMAGRFAAVWQRVLFRSPDLDANVKRPLTQMGTTIYQDQRNTAEKAALRRAASEAGFLFVYDDPVTCRLCLAQAEILTVMQREYGIEVLAVSTDGSAIDGFPGAVANDGQLERLGIADMPRPLIAIVETGTGEVHLIGGGLLTEDQILNRVYVVREVPLGARFE
ncbi:conjugal transfer protein TraF [Pukyongiella litopenaei]|uniref:conjugal transfer protein TraF n=1 Tax=Pukyongiella litopenaei TaxID=2605946 RepID=UPI001B7FFCD7|nr:conjugal transfer protein TraF [Pukyongiella litopenaei]